MINIGYHASHEQFSPSHLLNLVLQAENSGFTRINCSDHFHPWSERQGHSGFSFAWLGAAMQSTSLPFSIVCAPGQRYHPAIIAQAIATLGEMFPGRFSIFMGSGEALNESIVGTPWPQKPDRNERLHECHTIIRRLLSGHTVTHKGHVIIEEARIYSLPTLIPGLYGAAISKETAAWMAPWVDGLITTHRSVEELREIIAGFQGNGGAGKPISLKVQISYARNLEKAREGAFDQWRSNALPAEILATLSKVREFDKASENVSMNDLKKKVCISNDLEYFIDQIKSFASLGFDNIILHNVNKEQEDFIEDFGRFVLPYFK